MLRDGVHDFAAYVPRAGMIPARILGGCSSGASGAISDEIGIDKLTAEAVSELVGMLALRKAEHAHVDAVAME